MDTYEHITPTPHDDDADRGMRSLVIGPILGAAAWILIGLAAWAAWA